MDTDNLYDLIGQIHQYYQTRFNRDGGNNQGGTGNGTYAPVGNTPTYTYTDYLAAWNGLCPGAKSNSGILSFCRFMVQPDFVAHEYAHTIPYFTHQAEGGMVYQGEPGALNESYADVTGELFEYYRSGTIAWIKGMLDLCNPALSMTETYPWVPDRLYSPGFYCGPDDNGGVHRNSTVPTKAMCLAAMGGYFNGCTVDGIGREKVEQILYRAVTQYYSSTETFNGSYYKLIQACGDLALLGLYGIGTGDCAQLTRALQAVELDQAGACSGLPASMPQCLDLIGW